MNRAARLIKGLSTREHITPTLIDLHWLPIKARITFKVYLMTYQALKFDKPAYIRGMLNEFHIDSDMMLRHSVETNRLDEPYCNHSFGFRDFEKCAPRLYNKLPMNIRSADNTAIFKRKLKSYLFNECYDLHDRTIKPEYAVN